MKYSKSKYNEQARKLLLQGAKEVERAVGTTLGARGRNIVVHKNHQTKVLHDGVKIAQEVNPKNPFKASGAEILKQSARQQVSKVGDGTTLAIVLGYAIASEALKITESGVNPMGLRAGLEKGRDILISEIQKLSRPVKTKKQKIQVATISSEDEKMGELIGETYHKAGIDAVITAEDVVGFDTYLDHQEGMQIDSGYKHELFVTNPRNMTATLNNAKVLVTDYKLNDPFEFKNLFDALAADNQRSLLVIADDIEGNMLATLLNNKLKGTMNFLAVKAPSFQKENILQDIATVTGATFISSTTKRKLNEIIIDDLGDAVKVTSTKDATVISEGGGSDKQVKARIKSLRDQLKDEKGEFDKEKIRERLAKLTGGVYVIKVGGATEVEAEERKERADDAILATKAAIQEGIIPGGETIFLQVQDKLKPKNENEEYAYRILKRAIEKPFDKLMKNAGFDPGEMRARLNIKTNKDFGVDVTTGDIVNMYEFGIIDPALVAIEALRGATSVATSLITSDGIVAEYEEKDE